jgi:hypothetical protein
MRLPLFCLFALAALLGSARAEEFPFAKNDVIALAGGEDIVVASEYGYLETLLTRALPDYHLRFRNLAWEGDTVYEQRRDLNFPTWEEALDKIGATVVVCEFGQMESLDGKDKLPEFVAAYHKLLERFSAGGKRKIIVVCPNALTSPFASANRVMDMKPAIEESTKDIPRTWIVPGISSANAQRDGVHLSAEGQSEFAGTFGQLLASVQKIRLEALPTLPSKGGPFNSPEEENLRQLVLKKNKLWFDYWRVENWAFLFGDRTNQPSSRDWRDPSKRWFPAEREEFIPLIEAKEKDIDALATKMNQK